MAVCRYFLAGNCKYGARCFNEHPRGGAPPGGSGGRGVTFRDSFGTAANQQNVNPYKWTAPGNPQQQQQQPQQQQQAGGTVQDIIKSLPKEMEIWQASKMWPFSCFSLEKEIPCLPDFTDLSPEEVRHDAYNAIQQGTVDEHKQKVSQLVQDFRQKQDQIKVMPQALRQKLTEMLEEGRRQKAARAGGQSVVRPSTFGGGQTAGSVFGAAGGSVFGSSTTGPSPSSTSIFGSGAANSSASVFGMASPPGQSTSVFGQPTSAAGSVFGASQPTSSAPSVFGQPQPTTGLFGKGVANPPASSAGGGSVFGSGGGGAGIFAQPATSSGIPAPGLFSQGAAAGGAAGGGGFGQSAGTGLALGQAAGSVFGQNTGGGGGLFGKPPAASTASVFGQAPATSMAPAPGLFGNNPSQSSVFGASAAASGANPQPGLFGASQAGATGSVLGGGSTFGGAMAQVSPAAEASLYTPLADLTESEKAQFEASTFTLGMLPMRPPPKELINI